MSDRSSRRERITKETSVRVEIDLDGNGNSEINTGIGFLDHMLTLFSFNSKVDLNVFAKGDSYVCDHHTIEDIGITLGEAFKESLGDKYGINRYGTFYLPMDETLALASIDVSIDLFWFLIVILREKKLEKCQLKWWSNFLEPLHLMPE